HRRHAVSVEFNEFADDSVLPELFGNRQHQVGGGCAFGQFALEFEADHARNEHTNGLTEHGRLGFDTADAPADDSEAVDHRCVRIGTDQRIRIGLNNAVDFAGENRTRKMFDVYLVHDSGARRHDLEIIKCALSPAEELI